MGDQETCKAKRDSTIDVTTKEGMDYLKSEGFVPDSNNETGAAGDVEVLDKEDPIPKPGRDNTMIGTAKEAEILLATSGKPDPDALTRNQQKRIVEINSEKPEQPAAKKSKVAKGRTMLETAENAKAILGTEKLGETREGTKQKRQNKTTVKRLSTIQKTAKEAEAMLKSEGFDAPESVGRVTRARRSGNIPPPPLPKAKRANTMQKAAKDGKESKRGRGRPKKTTS